MQKPQSFLYLSSFELFTVYHIKRKKSTKNTDIFCKRTYNKDILKKIFKKSKKSVDKHKNLWYTRQVLKIWLVGQAVKTPASHAGNAGSIPARVTKRVNKPKGLNI